jgi:DNA-binding SARP family transcriptional activator
MTTTYGSTTSRQAPRGGASAARLEVSFLGGFHLRVGAATLGPRQLGGTKPRLILEALLAHGGAPVSKDRLVSMLWEGEGTKGSKANLETYTCVLRKHLHAAAPGIEDVIGSVAGSYTVDMSRVDLDLDRYRRLVATATDPRTSDADSLPLFVEALSLGEAELLPEEGDLEWLVDLRRLHAGSLRNQLVHGAVKVMDYAPSLSRHWSLRALGQDSLDEAAWIAYLSSLERLGLHAEGLRAYNDCRRIFSRELGCSPGRVLQETYVRLLRGANEANGELSRLLDAVVSLHTVADSRVPRTPVDRQPASRPVPTVSFDEARLVLSTLLSRVSTTTNGGAAAARTA